MPSVLHFIIFLGGLLIGEAVRRFAIRRALLDSPNARSLHERPTPRLGGIALVASAAVPALLTTRGDDVGKLVCLCLGLAIVGLRDDIKPLSSGLRFVVQLVLGSLAVWLLGCPPSFAIAPGLSLALPAPLLACALTVWIVAVLNIYNFMDGMDGLAGCQTVVAASSLALLYGPGDLASALTFVAVSALAFLVHNFPPARMFLGDAGSTFLGMLFAGAAIIGTRRGVPMTTSALALAPFLLDGTFTIVRRAARGERVWEAHRSHLYQRAVSAGCTHREVLLVYLVWMLASGIAAVTARTGAAPLAAGWAVSLAGLVLVRFWVHRLESEVPDLP